MPCAASGNSTTLLSPMPAVDVETGQVGRRDAGDQRRGHRAPREQRGAGEGMRPAAGDAPHSEPLGSDGVGDRSGVGRHAPDRAPLVA